MNNKYEDKNGKIRDRPKCNHIRYGMNMIWKAITRQQSLLNITHMYKSHNTQTQVIPPYTKAKDVSLGWTHG